MLQSLIAWKPTLAEPRHGVCIYLTFRGKCCSTATIVSWCESLCIGTLLQYITFVSIDYLLLLFDDCFLLRQLSAQIFVLYLQEGNVLLLFSVVLSGETKGPNTFAWLELWKRTQQIARGCKSSSAQCAPPGSLAESTKQNTSSLTGILAAILCIFTSYASDWALFLYVSFKELSFD